MNSRTRVLTALNHKEPDMVPLEIGQSSFTGISATAYRNLLKYLGKDKRDIIIHDRKQQLAKMDEDILKQLGIDARGVFFVPSSSWKFKQEEDGEYLSYSDDWDITWRMPKENGLYYDLWKSPLAGDNLAEEIKQVSWPDPYDKGRINNLVLQAKELKRQNEYFTMIGGCAMTVGYFQQFQWIQGMEKSYLNLAADPAGSMALLEKLEALEHSFWDWFLPEAGDLVDMMVIPDDFSGQNGLLISKEMFRTYFKPLYTRLFGKIKKICPNIKTFYHCCGSVIDLIPDFIEMGADILNPLQLSAAGMDPKKIKHDFGKDICFWGGGVDTQYILPTGTIEEVKNNVRKNIEELAPGGGYIFNTVHNIQADVPPQNLIAMIEAFNEYRKY